MPENVENEKMDQVSLDLETKTRTELRAAYPREYASWRNGKQRSKATGGWSPEFDHFPDFLRHLGPSPPGCTLDRIDNQNPLYAPSLVRWATKTEQANNRSTTRFVHRGETAVPAADDARNEGLHPDAARQRFRRQQTSESAFETMINDFRYRNCDPRAYRPWPRHRDDLPSIWERRWGESGGLKRGNSRYDYLISVARRGIQDASADLDKLSEAGLSAESVEMSEVFDRLERYRTELRRAWYEKPIWEEAVSKYERWHRARAKEKTALRQHNYLDPETEDDF